jgi:hypothetical protein
MVGLAALVVAGCGSAEDPGAPVPVTTSVAPVELVPRAFYARAEREDYWELVPLDTVGDHFLLHVHPRIRTPAEGPWTLTFRAPDGSELSRQPGLRVDTATGQFTFLCRRDAFRPGDWGIEMKLQEGGMTAGDSDRLFRFRVVDRAE